MSIFVKDPGASLDYAIDWAAGYLGNQGLTESRWSVTPGGPGEIGAGELVADGGRIDGGRALVTLSGGRAGCVYRVTNAVTFSDGSHDERTLVVRVEDR
ncbi:phage fiber-tail adaptor protein [Polymorphobacter sp.]|uniref:phage fiber-tail adaptor protein n=1 Tax=Polymorphobacter sp. TaxID=1909290 RepID=UPI003F6F8068